MQKKQTMPTISVICPIRNEEKYIQECLEALIDQTYPSRDIEILVVDGMSDDKTREIVNDLSKKDPRIRLIDNPERLVPFALNYGIENAKGKYILRMDGHAKAQKDYIEQCVAALDRNVAECVGGPIITIDVTDTGKAISAAMSSVFGVGNSRFRTSIDEELFVDTLAFPAYKKEAFQKYGRFDVNLKRCQDDEFNFRLRKLGGKILLTPAIRSWYYARSGFGKLWKQYFGYGLYKVRVLQKHFWMMQARHFIPAGFVGTLFALMTLSFIASPFLWLFACLFSCYGMASVWAASKAVKVEKKLTFWKVLLSFYILHFSYGSGFIFGLIKFFPLWFRAEDQR